jgi:hypothetical protein
MNTISKLTACALLSIAALAGCTSPVPPPLVDYENVYGKIQPPKGDGSTGDACLGGVDGYADIELSGGMTGSLEITTPVQCSAGKRVVMLATKNLTVGFGLPSLEAGKTGTFTDAKVAVWQGAQQAGVKGCTITITDNAKVGDFGGTSLYRVAGHGSCNQAATGTTASPVKISGFEFVGTVVL